MASRLCRLRSLTKSIINNHHASLPMISTYKYHGGRHFKKYYPNADWAGKPTGEPASIPALNPGRFVPQKHAPYYQDYERQIEAAKRREALEDMSKPTQLLEEEIEASEETDLVETPKTALMERETDPFVNPSDLVPEYGYSQQGDLEYYNMPNTKVLEFHTPETVGKPLVETPEPVFVPDEHWIWEDPLEAQQDATIHEETVMDS